MRFPKMHIAQSVLNRLTNFSNGLESQSAPPVLPYQVPQAQEMGKALDQALAQPAQPVSAPGEDVAVAAALEGTSPAEALTMEGVLNDQA